jgi:hypothetical protein
VRAPQDEGGTGISVRGSKARSPQHAGVLPGRHVGARPWAKGPECVAVDAIGASQPLADLPLASCHLHFFKQLTFLPSRCVAARGFRLLFLFAPSSQPAPLEGGRSAGRRPALNFGRAGNARRHACEAWALPRNREAASRRSTVALSARLPPPSPALPPNPARRLHAVGHLRLAAVPGFPAAVTSRGRRHTPAPPSGSSPEDALDERNFRIISQTRFVVNIVVTM